MTTEHGMSTMEWGGIGRNTPKGAAGTGRGSGEAGPRESTTPQHSHDPVDQPPVEPQEPRLSEEPPGGFPTARDATTPPAKMRSTTASK